ncbi:DNA-binding protein [Halobacteriales archaeon QS_5_70_15]|nr:MAG: DNA-binding protein [Halobacteriales archaeon QS_5_70_15]
MSERPIVAVVDDEPELADLFAAWLEGSYEVRTAYGGSAALEAIDDDVDVALVDRLMPDTPGDEVVAALTERGWTGAVAMVTAVEPDFDILELGFDDYLVKPVYRDALETTIARLLERSTYDRQVRELFALAAKRATLEARKSDPELAENEEYRRLCRAIDELRARVDETALDLDDSGFEMALRGIE